MYDQAAITAVPAGAASAALVATSQVAIGVGVLLVALIMLAVITVMRAHRLDTN